MLAKATLKELAKKINPSSRVLMRTDYNVPIKNNKIEDLKRITCSLLTILSHYSDNSISSQI